MEKIFAIVVTYFPEENYLQNLLVNIKDQVNHVVIVDNTGGSYDFAFEPDQSKITLVHNEQNLGVAKAYNQGFEIAIANSADYVILFDQDSAPDKIMVEELKMAYVHAEGKGITVAAAGPKYSDKKGNMKSPFVINRGFRLERIACNSDQVVNVDHLISSGSLISVGAYKIVGPFREELFIDYVDTEWCLRARTLHYALLGVGAAKMMHNLGDSYISIMGSKIPYHSCLRHYYLVRNGVWIIKQKWVGWRWRFTDGWRLLKVFFAFSLFGNNRLEHTKAMLMGLYDGLSSKMGRRS